VLFEGLGIVTAPVTFSELVPLIVNVVFELTAANVKEAHVNAPSTVRILPFAIVSTSTGPTPCDLKFMFVLVDAATEISVRCVLSVIEATVPIVTLVEFLIILPTLISVVKDVPDPVIFKESVEDEIVPVRVVLGQAVALQFPVVLLVIFEACNLTTNKSNNAVSNIPDKRSLINCRI